VRTAAAPTAVLASAVACVGLAVLGAPSTEGASSRPQLSPTAVSVPGDGGSDPVAVTLLRRASQAAKSTAYSGVRFVTGWSRDGSVSRMVDVRHIPSKGTVYRVQGTASDPDRAGFVREDEDPSTVGDDSAGLAVMSRTYTVAVSGDDAVAGRPATVIVALRQNQQVAARLWIDQETGLLTRREVFDDDGDVTQASAFLTLSVGAEVATTASMPPQTAVPWRGDTSTLATLRKDGWACPETLAGDLVLYDARRLKQPSGSVLHLSYTDGLLTLSIFQQPGHLDLRHAKGWHVERLGGRTVRVHPGVPEQVSWSAYGTVYTVVADAPRKTVAAAVAALPVEDQNDGLGSRMGRGWSRVASWLNPFG
jgi:hypothetical protein